MLLLLLPGCSWHQATGSPSIPFSSFPGLLQHFLRHLYPFQICAILGVWLLNHIQDSQEQWQSLKSAAAQMQYMLVCECARRMILSCSAHHNPSSIHSQTGFSRRGTQGMQRSSDQYSFAQLVNHGSSSKLQVLTCHSTSEFTELWVSPPIIRQERQNRALTSLPLLLKFPKIWSG